MMRFNPIFVSTESNPVPVTNTKTKIFDSVKNVFKFLFADGSTREPDTAEP